MIKLHEGLDEHAQNVFSYYYLDKNGGFDTL